jgi:hypothetical protein
MSPKSDIEVIMFEIKGSKNKNDIDEVNEKVVIELRLPSPFWRPS